jgi:hypothetical protein
MRKDLSLIAATSILIVSVTCIPAKAAVIDPADHKKATCIAACFGCGFTLGLGNALCMTWLECLDQVSFAPPGPDDNAQLAVSSWLTNISSVVTTGADLQSAIDTFTPNTAPGHSWSLGFDAGLLSVTNTGIADDIGLPFIISSAGRFDLSSAQSVVPVSSGQTASLLLPALPSTPFFIEVFSASGPGKNGDGFALITVVPEASTLTLLGMGALWLIGCSWRRAKQLKI